MFSTTLPLLPHMMAHASSADAPFDSEVSNADLDSEVSATTPSATPSSPPTTTTTTSELQQLVMLSQLMDSASTASLSSNLSLSLSSDPSIIAMTSSSSSSSSSSDWSSPSISPMVLKLESPVLTHRPEPSSSAAKMSKSRRASSTTAAPSTTESASSASSNSSSRKRSAADPMDKDAKARERVLRNRAAAQESRDKKRKYVTEIEASNESLQEENCQLLKRLKTVESDNQSLSHRLETLTAQFSLMQQQLAMTMSMTGVVSNHTDNDIKKNNTHSDENTINNQPGVGFCQSAVLAKKDKSNILTNSPQQKLTPSKGNSHTTTSHSNKHRRVYSMTTMTSMSKTKSLNREARLSGQSAAQNRTEISCRPFCNNSRKRTLTLSSSAAASSPTAGTRPLALFMMVFLTNMLPQLMLNFSTLFLISTGAQSSNPQAPLPPQEQRLQQLAQFFIQRQPFSSRLSNQQQDILHHRLQAQSGSIKNTISSLNTSVVEEIVTEFRQGRKDVARGLLVRALLSSPKALDNDSIKGLFLFRKD